MLRIRVIITAWASGLILNIGLLNHMKLPIFFTEVELGFQETCPHFLKLSSNADSVTLQLVY